MTFVMYKGGFVSYLRWHGVIESIPNNILHWLVDPDNYYRFTKEYI